MVKMGHMSEMFTSKPLFIKLLRNFELPIFLKQLNSFNFERVVDLGCGEDFFLKKYIGNKKYLGADIFDSTEKNYIKCDVRELDFTVFDPKNDLLTSFGLFYFLNREEKLDVLNKMQEFNFIVQVNRNDTFLGKLLERYDSNKKLTFYYENKVSIKNLLSDDINLIPTSVSFILWSAKNENILRPNNSS
jgi:hypothetical protein